MGKAIVIGIIIIAVIVGCFAVVELNTNEHGKAKEAAITLGACFIILVMDLIFGGIWYF